MNCEIKKQIELFILEQSKNADDNLNFNSIMSKLLKKFNNRFTQINKLLLDTCTNYFFQQNFFKQQITDNFHLKEEKLKSENSKLKSY